MRTLLLSVFLVVLAGCGPTSAPPASSATGLTIADAYAAPSPNGVDIAAGYLRIENHGESDRLTSATSSRAAKVELHTMEMDGAVMRMRAADALVIPANGELTLSPGGDHLMFMELTAPFAVGETIPVHLEFEHAGAMDIDLPVRGAGH